MYYDREDSDDKQDFIGLCNARDLAKELLSENENDITTGEQAINSNSLPNQDITITRTISLDDANNNQAIIEYEAELDSKVIATIQTTLVPNAVIGINSMPNKSAASPSRTDGCGGNVGDSKCGDTKLALGMRRNNSRYNEGWSTGLNVLEPR